MIPESAIRNIRSNLEGLLVIYVFAGFIALVLILAGIGFFVSLLMGEFLTQDMIAASGVMIIAFGTFLDIIILLGFWDTYRKEKEFVLWKRTTRPRSNNVYIAALLYFPALMFLLTLFTNAIIILLIAFVMTVMFVFVIVNMWLIQIPLLLIEYCTKRKNRPLGMASSLPMVFLLSTMPFIPFIAHYSGGPILDIWSIYLEIIYVMVVGISIISFIVLKRRLGKILNENQVR